MKSIKFLIVCMTTIVAVQSQTISRKALLIHGFGSSSATWYTKNTPADLTNPPNRPTAIVDSCITFSYELDFLEGAQSSQLLDLFIQNMVEPLKDTLNAHIGENENVQWVIIGHSLGGLIARMAVPYLNNYDIRGVMTIATPHQGAPAADVTGDYQTVQSFHEDLQAGPDAGIHSMAFMGAILGNWNGLLVDYFLPDIIANSNAEAREWIDLASGVSAGDHIGLNGDIIQLINLLQQEITIDHRSIIGSERSPTIIRWLPELDFIPSLPSWYTTFNELSSKHFYDDFKTWYHSNVHWWHVTARRHEIVCIPWLGLGNNCEVAAVARAKKEAWRRGEVALADLDATWSELIGGIESYNTWRRVWHSGYWDCRGQDGLSHDGEVMRAIRNGTYNFELDSHWGEPDDDYSCTWIDEPWSENIPVTIAIPTKNDGLVQPKQALWKTMDPWTPENPVNMHDQSNYYYGDDPDIFEDGGWNHSEQIRYTRIYRGEDVTPYPPGEAIETPLKANADWIQTRFSP